MVSTQCAWRTISPALGRQPGSLFSSCRRTRASDPIAPFVHRAPLGSGLGRRLASGPAVGIAPFRLSAIVMMHVVAAAVARRASPQRQAGRFVRQKAKVLDPPDLLAGSAAMTNLDAMHVGRLPAPPGADRSPAPGVPAVEPPEREHQCDHQHDPGRFVHGPRASARSAACMAAKVTFPGRWHHDIAQAAQAAFAGDAMGGLRIERSNRRREEIKYASGGRFGPCAVAWQNVRSGVADRLTEI